MLAIHENPSVIHSYYLNKGNKKKQEEDLYQWMTEELGITAWFPENVSYTLDKKYHPSKFLFKDVL